MILDTEHALEECLSMPSDADAEAMAELKGELLILGAGGKMGPSLARRAKRAALRTNPGLRIIAVSRFGQGPLASQLQNEGIETLACDLLRPGSLAALPDARNVIFMAARKFGTTGSAHLTWGMNTFLPGLVAERYRSARIVAFSTGNVYPLSQVTQGGSVESSATDPTGEYAQSALGRERMFEYGSSQWGTPVALLRLNYAIDLRYGVLLDVARAVFENRPVDLRMGMVNVIWQADANSVCLRSLSHCAAPPFLLNVTGPETLPVELLAKEFGERFGVMPRFEGEPATTALLSNAAKAHQLFGYPTVTVGQMIDWTADWVRNRRPTLDKPTHFQVRDGKF